MPLHADIITHSTYRSGTNYKCNPTTEKADLLSAEFDILFSTKTGYDELDDRIAKSKAKKDELLTVLGDKQ